MKKINWGTSILIAFILFISFILFFIVRIQSNAKYDNELVVEEYYKHDAHYSEELAKIENAENLKAKPLITNTDDGITITFPKEFIPKEIKGKVSLYRPSAKVLDFEQPLRLSNSTMRIPKADFAGGNWGVTLSWSYLGKNYISKEKIYIR